MTSQNNHWTRKLSRQWERFTVVRSADEETTRLGRLFVEMMLINVGMGVGVGLVLVLARLQGGWSFPFWVAALFPTVLTLLSILLIVLAKKGRVRQAIRLAIWSNFVGATVSIILLGGTQSPSWSLYAWVIVMAGTLASPAYALWMAGLALGFYLLLNLLAQLGFPTSLLLPPDEWDPFITTGFAIVMLVWGVGIPFYINMRSLREAMTGLRKTRKELEERVVVEQKQRQQLDTMVAVSTQILSTTHLQQVRDTLCREAVNLLQGTSAYVNDWDDENQTLTVVAEWYSPEAASLERASDLGHVYEEEEHFLDWLTVDRPYIARVSDSQMPERERAEIEQYGGKSVIYFPLIAHGRIIGYFEVWESRYDRAFTEEEILLGQNLASQAAIALQNARLLQAIQETVRELSSAADEILGATVRLADSAAEQAQAVAQATATVEEAQVIAQQSVEQAQTVTGNAQRTVQISMAGHESVQETVNGMAQIKSRVAGIAQTISDLSLQTQRIHAVIATVSEIASRSDILALNAAVEAARAGEYGREFAVVAGEVRSLAEQSHKAAEQVWAILESIRQAANAAVKAMQEGTGEVEQGVKLAQGTGEAIALLSRAIDESAQAAVRLAADGQQQAAGMEQIARAMQDIDQKTVESLSSTKRVEKAARDLDGLAHRLAEIVNVSARLAAE